ncbi:MAG TPA: hypothetical protein VK927_08895, partial [Adhaeribacter sp.]|nr:hypothetical protein [Adhaeribacter sp.]
MTDYFKKLFETASFIPHGQSYLWEGDVLAAQLVGDGLIALACFAIPPALLYFIRRRRDLSHQHVFLFFAFFILILGITHILEIVTLWKPLFRLQSFFKVLTGLISLITAFLIYRSLPLLLKLPSQARLENMNRKLRQEVTEREKAQVALREANAMLESRVQQRTSQLIKINRELEKEIEQRRNTEQELKEKNQELVRINSDLDNFVYCASADLKAPIVNIEGLVTALKEEMPQRSHHVEEILDRLDGSLLKVDRTVLDLNEVSRLQKAGL